MDLLQGEFAGELHPQEHSCQVTCLRETAKLNIYLLQHTHNKSSCTTNKAVFNFYCIPPTMAAQDASHSHFPIEDHCSPFQLLLKKVGVAGVSTSHLPPVLGGHLPLSTTFHLLPISLPTSHLFLRPTSHQFVGPTSHLIDLRRNSFCAVAFSRTVISAQKLFLLKSITGIPSLSTVRYSFIQLNELRQLELNEISQALKGTMWI